MKKLLAIIGALIAGGLGVAVISAGTQASTRWLLVRIEGIEMRKVLAIIGALIGGGLGIALISSGTQGSTRSNDRELKERTKMRKLLAIIGAMIAGGSRNSSELAQECRQHMRPQ